MDRVDFLQMVKSKAIEYQTRFSNDVTIESILKQLDFLIALSEGKRFDRERLADIIIGILTVREIEPVDYELAEQLYKVVDIVEEMKREA